MPPPVQAAQIRKLVEQLNHGNSIDMLMAAVFNLGGMAFTEAVKAAVVAAGAVPKLLRLLDHSSGDVR